MVCKKDQKCRIVPSVYIPLIRMSLRAELRVCGWGSELPLEGGPAHLCGTGCGKGGEKNQCLGLSLSHVLPAGRVT